MFGQRITVFRLLGFEVKLDASWLILAALIVWTLGTEVFPHYYPDLARELYWLMALGGTAGLFFSIVFHELCHSLVARRFGVPLKGITLFVFGGVAEITREPPSAKAEFLMAVAGPLSSLSLALIFLILNRAGRISSWPVSLTGVVSYVAFLNLMLAIFNLLPAFPLDGGRIFRSALWAWKKDLVLATRVAAMAGSGFAILLMVGGIISLFTASPVAGIWWILIGLFLKKAAETSYRQVLWQKFLEGQKVKQFMRPNPITVPSGISLQQFVEDFVYTYHHRVFPVVGVARLLGCIHVRALKNISKEEWPKRTVAELMEKCSLKNTVSPDEDANQVLTRMNRTGNTRLLVVEDEKLLGIVSLKDMLSFISLRLELEGAGQPSWL